MDAHKAYSGGEPEHSELLKQIREVIPIIKRLRNGKVSSTALFDALHCPPPDCKPSDRAKYERAQEIISEARKQGIHLDKWAALATSSLTGGTANDRFRQFIWDHREILGGYFVEKKGKKQSRYYWTSF